MDIVGCIPPSGFHFVLLLLFSFICGLILQGWSKESKSNGVLCWAMTTNSMMSKLSRAVIWRTIVHGSSNVHDDMTDLCYNIAVDCCRVHSVHN